MPSNIQDVFSRKTCVDICVLFNLCQLGKKGRNKLGGCCLLCPEATHNSLSYFLNLVL